MTPGEWALLFVAVAVVLPLLVVGVAVGSWAAHAGAPGEQASFRLDDELQHMHRADAP